MRLPKRGEKGFTLIELLIVVAILGVLAAVVIPNVGRFIGRGEAEAKETEFANIQSATISMMTDNNLPSLSTPVGGSGNQTNNMGAFPDRNTTFILYGYTDNVTGATVNYVATNQTAYWYGVNSMGTVTQYDTAAP